MLKEDIPGEWAGNWICVKGDYKNDLGDYFIQKKEGIEYVTKEDFVSLKAEREMITDEMEVRFILDTWLLKKAVQDQKVEQAIDGLVTKLRSRSKIEVHEDVLASLRITAAPAEEKAHPGGPMDPQ